MATKKTVMVGAKPDKQTAGSAPRAPERREAPRLKVPRVDAEVVTLGLRARVLDIAFGGLSIESEHEFHIDEIHTLRAATSQAGAAGLRVRVVHCRQEGPAQKRARYVTGFEFVDPWCPGDGSAADEFISEVTRELAKARGR